MRREHISELVCAGGQHRLNLQEGALEEQGDIKEGALTCVATCPTVPIRGSVPRFVPDSGYSQNFGEQWNHFRRTQIDKFNGTDLSKERFYSGTGWSPAELKGAKILEAGCGAGRFTQVMLDAGAQVYSVDLSSAVDACFVNNGPRETCASSRPISVGFPFGIIRSTRSSVMECCSTRLIRARPS